MRVLLIGSFIALVPSLGLADAQCVLPTASFPENNMAGGRVGAVERTTPTAPATSANEFPPAEHDRIVAGTGSPALDHVASSGSQLTEVGTSHGLRTVVARTGDQFLRMYVKSLPNLTPFSRPIATPLR